MAREDPQLKIRLPEELKERVEKAAKENNRSMNAEITARIEQSFHLEPLRDAKREELLKLVHEAIDERMELQAQRAAAKGLTPARPKPDPSL